MRRFFWLLTIYLAGSTWSIAATLELATPTEYQVFQRQSRLDGMLHIAGKLTGDGQLQYRITGKPLEGELPADWQPLPTTTQNGNFDAQMSMPAGGWYRLELRLFDGTQDVVHTAVEHVGIGEVFIIAGQSNSANHGEERQQPTSELVVAFDGSRWAPAVDPQPGASGNGGSFIPAFGDAMAKTFQVPIGVVCLGAGGTSVREWLPKGEPIAAPPTTGANIITLGPNSWASAGTLFERLDSHIRALGPKGFRAALWHQGESDYNQQAGCNITPEQYRQYLARLIESTRRSAGWEIPWFVAQASYHNPDHTGSAELRAAQLSLVEDGAALAGPNTDALGPEYREEGGRGVHFNARGLRRHGELWAECVAVWLQALLEAERWEPDIKRFEAADRQNPPPQNAILFIGSSGIALWHTLTEDFPNHKVVNRGFGGSYISDCVCFVDRIIVPYKPRLIVLRAGVNDIAAGKSPEQVFADFRWFVRAAHAKLPDARIAFMALNPSIARWANFEKESRANQLIREYIASHDKLDYIDVVGAMLGADGRPRPELFAEDLLHNSPEGYRLWASLVRPHLPPVDQ